MVIDAGRIKHLGDLMHKSIASNGTAVASNWKLSADGLTNVVWTPESAGGSVSYGSNSNDVGNASAAGASSLVSRADHVHRGVRAVSHSSNTLYGDVEFQTEGSLYIVKPAGNIFKLGSTGAAAGGGGSGGVTHTYVGYNTVGASFENLTNSRQTMKKITLSTAGLLTAIELHLKVPTTTDIVKLIAIVLDDSSNAPNLLIGQSYTWQFGFKNGNAARWFAMPIGKWLTAGDYWIGFTVENNASNSCQIAYDTGGADKIFAVGAFGLDGNYAATTDSTKHYSIRASVIT